MLLLDTYPSSLNKSRDAYLIHAFMMLPISNYFRTEEVMRREVTENNKARDEQRCIPHPASPPSVTTTPTIYQLLDTGRDRTY